MLWMGLTCLIATGTSYGQLSPDFPGTRSDVESTFDPEGPYDHDDLMKDQGGTAEEDAFQDARDEGAPIRTAMGGPTNDSCNSGTVIPGNTVNYNAPLILTSTAGNELCQGSHGCGHPSGNTNSVWYRYTPDMDGYVHVNTAGSTYDTVLSINVGCGYLTAGFSCVYPTELACSNNLIFGGQTSEIRFFEVTAGQAYVFMVSDYDPTNGGGVLDFNLQWVPLNNICSSATVVGGVSFDPPMVSTINATADNCEAQESCELGNVGISNTVWYSHTAVCDGTISINTNGSTYDTVLSIHDGCGAFVGIDTPCDLPAELDCDDDAGTGLNSQIMDFPVIGGETYMIKVADYNSSQGGGMLDFNLVFHGANPPVAEITTPDPFDCVCEQFNIMGTAAGVDNDLAGYTLDYMPANGGILWTEITSSTTPVANGLLGTLNTAGLTHGYYFVRLTVENGCGLSSTAVSMVLVDKVYENFVVTSPNDNAVLGGNVCVLGTIWDHCPDRYAIEYAPMGSSLYSPIDPSQPAYTTNVTNSTLGSWDTVGDGIDDGDYHLLISATDDCGHEEGAQRMVTIDNTAPETEITSVENCDTFPLNSVIQVMGTASDDNMSNWILEYTGGNSNSWVTIDTGGNSITNGLLGIWDTTGLPSCSYTLRIRAVDEAIVNCNPAIHHHSEFTVSVKLGVCVEELQTPLAPLRTHP
jgi:hypothetical protein